jgi:hypothetical protein
MIESLQQLWPVMCGSEGILAAAIAWRGFLAVAVPIFNAQLKAKFTQLLVDSPRVANSIVKKPWWKTLDLILKMTIGIQLPNTNSIIVHEVKKSGNTDIISKRKSNLLNQMKIELRKAVIVFLTVVILASLAVVICGCSSFKTIQNETRNETEGIVQITTTVKAHTFFDSKSGLSNFKASQSEKTQGASVGSLVQESDGTNAVKALEQLNLLLQRLGL